METKTLLTISALLVAGMLTIMLARGDEKREQDISRDNTAQTKQWDSIADGNRRQPGHNHYNENYRNNGEAMER
jgi:hypothetical protein